MNKLVEIEGQKSLFFIFLHQVTLSRMPQLLTLMLSLMLHRRVASMGFCRCDDNLGLDSHRPVVFESRLVVGSRQKINRPVENKNCQHRQTSKRKTDKNSESVEITNRIRE